VNYSERKPSINQLKRHLEKCNDLFPTPLSDRVDFDEYVKKLVDNACFLSFFNEDESEIIACLAYYTGDNFFISSLSVLNDFQNKGLAKFLMARLLSFCDDKKILLEVEVSNFKAIDFYENHGFIESSRTKKNILLER